MQVIAVCQDQQCLNQWVVIVIVKTLPFHVWKQYVKRLDDKMVRYQFSFDIMSYFIILMASLCFNSLSDFYLFR